MKIFEMCKVDPIFLRSSGDLTFHSARGASATHSVVSSTNNPFQSDAESDNESSKWAGSAGLDLTCFCFWYFRVSLPGVGVQLF